MAEVIRLPKMSDTMTEGVIASWLVKVGDKVESGDILAEVETDKATMELENYDDGTVLFIGDAKKPIPVDGVIAIIGEPGEDFAALLAAADSPAEEAAPAKAEEAPVVETKAPAADAIDTSGIAAAVVKMPKMSDTMTEGVIANWLVKVGDKVASGDILAEVETDKATMELENYEDGTLLYIGTEAGGSVPVDGVIAIIGELGADFETLLKAEAQTAAAPAETPAAPAQKAAPAPTASTVAAPAKTVVNRPAASSDGRRIAASPLAKKMAADLGYDLASISGTGEGGRIIKRDVEDYTPAGYGGPSRPQVESFRDEPNSQMRKVIARSVSDSKFTAPHFYITMDIDMDNAMEARKTMNAAWAPAKVSFNDMVIKAAAAAIRLNPNVNCAWQGEFIRYSDHINIAVAMSVDGALTMPVVRFADTKPLTGISAEVKEYSKKAKAKKLQPTDWAGSTFSISNLGMFGIEEFTSILNAPDACIMAVGGIKNVPVVKNGQIVPGNVMKVTLTCDHRAVDGATGAAFLKDFKAYLEEPLRLFL